MSISLLDQADYSDLKNSDTSQRSRVIHALESEIKHYTLAMKAIQTLPSSNDKEMPAAYDAYSNLVQSYQKMIDVRFEIIEKLKQPKI